jgi:hypothetical protein
VKQNIKSENLNLAFLLKHSLIYSKYKFVRSIKVTNNLATALLNFQIAITLDTQSLINAGKIKSDGSDIRIVSANGQALPLWVEAGTLNTTTTKIWTKVNLNANETRTLYLLYGNKNAQSISNGDAVFDFFDDFNGSSLDTTKWTSSNLSSVTVSNSTAYVVTNYLSGTSASLTTVNNVVPINSITEVKVKPNSGTDHIVRPTLYVDNSNYFGINITKYYNGVVDFYAISGTVTENSIKYETSIPSDYRIMKLTRNGSNTISMTLHYTSRDQIGNSKNISYTNSNDMKITFISYGGTSSYSGQQSYYIDWVLVRKFASTEPTVTLGNEIINK